MKLSHSPEISCANTNLKLSSVSVVYKIKLKINAMLCIQVILATDPEHMVAKAP